jgi:hypothetical protein
MASSTGFPHPASVGNVDHCGLCGRHIPSGEYRRTTVFGKPGSEDVHTQICRDHLVPSATQRGNLEIVAAANAATPGLIEVTPTNAAEHKHYVQAYVRARSEIVDPRPSAAPRRVNGSSGRPKTRSSRSSAASGDSGDSDSDEPPAPDWRWATPPGWLKQLHSRLLAIQS